MKIKTEKKQRKKPIIYTLTNRSVIFLTALLTVTILLYITGNITEFTDKNLLIILSIIQVVSVLNMFFCLASILQSIIFSIKNKDSYYLIFILPVFFSFAIALIAFIFTGTLKVISLGSN